MLNPLKTSVKLGPFLENIFLSQCIFLSYGKHIDTLTFGVSDQGLDFWPDPGDFRHPHHHKYHHPPLTHNFPKYAGIELGRWHQLCLRAFFKKSITVKCLRRGGGDLIWIKSWSTWKHLSTVLLVNSRVKKISLKDIYVWQVLTCCGDRTVKGRVWMAFSCQSHHQELFFSFSPQSDIFDGKINHPPHFIRIKIYEREQMNSRC